MSVRRRENGLSPPTGAHGFTLIEVLVALALSVLILRLVVPMLSATRHGPTATQRVPATALATWRSVLREDLSNLVAPVKCGVPVLQIHRPSPTNAYDRLELQTLSRPGASGWAPLAASYVLEADGDADGLSLVRYGRGWHDNVLTRHVLLTGISSWSLMLWPAALHAATRPTTTPSVDDGRSGALVVMIEQHHKALDRFVASVPTGIRAEASR